LVKTCNQNVTLAISTNVKFLLHGKQISCFHSQIEMFIVSEGTLCSLRVFDSGHNPSKECRMRAVLLPAALAVAVTGFLLNSAPASAKGCVKGAVIGGVAGHFAGHHGLLGAGAGCIVGRHEANKHARQRDRAYQEGSGDRTGYGSSVPYDDRGYGRGYGPR
jgi:hypothetical protein